MSRFIILGLYIKEYVGKVRNAFNENSKMGFIDII